MVNWHDRLNQVIKEHGETPGGLARIIGVAKPTTKSWTDGNTADPGAFQIEKVCAHYGLNSRWLLTGELPKHNDSNAIYSPMTGIEAKARRKVLKASQQDIIDKVSEVDGVLITQQSLSNFESNELAKSYFAANIHSALSVMEEDQNIYKSLPKCRQYWVAYYSYSMGRAVLSASLGYDDDAYVTQVINGNSSLGNNNAQKWCDKLGFEQGWLDRVPRHVSSPSGSQDLLTMGTNEQLEAIENAAKSMPIGALASLVTILSKALKDKIC